MVKRRVEANGAVRICKMNTEVLKRVNKRIQYYLDRLPLTSQKDIVVLNRYLIEQERLVRVHIKRTIPCRILVFNDNERHRACHLRRRFKDACRRGTVRSINN